MTAVIAALAALFAVTVAFFTGKQYQKNAQKADAAEVNGGAVKAGVAAQQEADDETERIDSIDDPVAQLAAAVAAARDTNDDAEKE